MCWVKTPYLLAGGAGLQRRGRQSFALQWTTVGDHVHTVGCNQGRHFRGHTENRKTLLWESGKHTPRRCPSVLSLKKKIKVGEGFQGLETRCAIAQEWASSRGSENCTLLCSAAIHSVSRQAYGWLMGHTLKDQCARQRGWTLFCKKRCYLPLEKSLWKEYGY